MQRATRARHRYAVARSQQGMHMTRTLWLAVLLAAAPCLQAQDWGRAGDPDAAALEQARIAAHRAQASRLAQALAKAGGARELAFAALLQEPMMTTGAVMDADAAPSRRAPADAQATAWLRVAQAKAGNDVLAHQLVIAATTDDAVRDAAARRWQAAEPDNLVPLLSLGLPAEALLAQAARATEADVHLYDGVRWMRSVLARHPPTPDEQRALTAGEPFHADEAAAVAAMAYAAAGMLPSYHALVQACRGTALQVSAARAGDCRHVANLLADRSDNVLGERVGLSMLLELAPRGAERTAIEARQRRMDWQMQQWGRLASQQPRDGAAQFARLLDDPSIRSERQLLARVLQEGGVASEPPEGWRLPRY